MSDMYFMSWSESKRFKSPSEKKVPILSTERGGVILPRRHADAKISMSLAAPYI